MEGEMDEAIPSTSSSLPAREKLASDGDNKRKTAFMEEYSEALDKEINSSSLGKSFVRSQTGQGTGDKVKVLIIFLRLFGYMRFYLVIWYIWNIELNLSSLYVQKKLCRYMSKRSYVNYLSLIVVC